MLAQKTAEGNIQETELERLRHALQSMAPTRLALIWLELKNINICNVIKKPRNFLRSFIQAVQSNIFGLDRYILIFKKCYWLFSNAEEPSTVQDVCLSPKKVTYGWLFQKASSSYPWKISIFICCVANCIGSSLRACKTVFSLHWICLKLNDINNILRSLNFCHTDPWFWSGLACSLVPIWIAEWRKHLFAWGIKWRHKMEPETVISLCIWCPATPCWLYVELRVWMTSDQCHQSN